MDRFISSMLKKGVIISTLGLIAIVLLQIYARFFMAQAPAWTEEASRLCFIYATSFAAGLALKNNYYVHLDYFYNLFSKNVQRRLKIIIPVLTVFLFLILAFYSLEFIYLGRLESSPSLKIKMAFIFVSILIMSLSVSYYAFKEVMAQIKNEKP
ncbi:TRAP transporter small permease subunit [Aureibaculum algae]|uniref:TRAP transporter small permease subunit n=1 Tax=Aureibaculum algae TaxID=2584122 RepID=A0A5B7TVL5_9FLAO|nr:TRAP transporter small permease subunit [Aureibaculum algae]QCX40360.1 TRAP transporter small permease subunit [Aureibaculum algae]